VIPTIVTIVVFNSSLLPLFIDFFMLMIEIAGRTLNSSWFWLVVPFFEGSLFNATLGKWLKSVSSFLFGPPSVFH